jgi:hypothetical protein
MGTETVPPDLELLNKQSRVNVKMWPQDLDSVWGHQSLTVSIETYTCF